LEIAPGLNPALTQAAHFAGDRGATGVLVLPADLPLLTAHDLETMLTYIAPHPQPFSPRGRGVGGEGQPRVVIAPCRRETGTNALLVRPTDLIPLAFGPDSFAAHCAAARAAGVEPVVYRSNTIALDLDTPEDWEMADLRLEI
jgi:2-phospho-L-lactate guanylyltransferase